ncbi:MAG: DUF4159 domain-containing protein [Planctomycetales bacterium]|nr:DUF4159 domain-containing protein [Planctomycetales bacterium]
MRLLVIVLCVLSAALVGFAQRTRSSGGGRRQAATRDQYPTWAVDDDFKHDVFTFTRIQYGGYGRSSGGWSNDYPDCDWNFSVRLHQLTSMKVDPNGKVFRLTDPELFNYPFAYMSNVQNMVLSPEEAAAMRKYCLNGGFIMADDFWAAEAWRHVKREMDRVFPDRQPRELDLSHEIFHMVYDLKEMPQVPSYFAWQDGEKVERWHGSFEGDEAPHFHGYFDDDGRLMALLCHNNDIGDGWEREGEHRGFFDQYSIKISYPLGINIVTYAMTH